jgi:tetratricopeptide (TPR) repeat protein
VAVSFKDVQLHMNRAKVYVQKGETLKALDTLVEGMRKWGRAGAAIIGHQRMQLDVLLNEVLKGLGERPEIKAMFPKGIPFQKGKEKALLQLLDKTQKRIRTAMRRIKTQKTRQQFNDLDKQVLEGQKLLDAEKTVEARKLFRKLLDTYAEVPGVNQDIGTRLFKAGQVQESLDFFRAALSQDPKDPRPYSSLIQALEGLGELDEAVSLVRDVFRNFGPNERNYLRLAMLLAKLRRFDEAYDAANSALECNPFNRQAKSLRRKLEPKVLGRAANG